jgi:hypothetical protein
MVNKKNEEEMDAFNYDFQPSAFDLQPKYIPLLL